MQETPWEHDSHQCPRNTSGLHPPNPWKRRLSDPSVVSLGQVIRPAQRIVRGNKMSLSRVRAFINGTRPPGISLPQWKAVFATVAASTAWLQKKETMKGTPDLPQWTCSLSENDICIIKSLRFGGNLFFHRLAHRSSYIQRLSCL